MLHFALDRAIEGNPDVQKLPLQLLPIQKAARIEVRCSQAFLSTFVLNATLAAVLVQQAILCKLIAMWKCFFSWSNAWLMNHLLLLIATHKHALRIQNMVHADDWHHRAGDAAEMWPAQVG